MYYHFDDHSVDEFSVAMKDKLSLKRKDGLGGWEDKAQCSNEHLSRLLRSHVDKGDPVDVANLAMMIHQRGEKISPQYRDAVSRPFDEIVDACLRVWFTTTDPDTVDPSYRVVMTEIVKLVLDIDRANRGSNPTT